MAQLKNLTVEGDSELKGSTKITSILDAVGDDGSTDATTPDKVLKSNDEGKIYWGDADQVSFSPELTTGTKLGTITINNESTNLYCENTTLSSIAYCPTAALTADKIATMPGFALSSGQRIFLRTTHANRAITDVTLNINNTGAKPVKIGDSSTPPTISNFPAGDYIANYNGENWILTRIYLNNTNYYHTTGSWSGLTYTTTANGGAEELQFTIPTGTSETTVALGNHTHLYADSASAGGAATSADKVNKAITFSNNGKGAASGITFNGSADRTISYNTIGAASSEHTHTTSLTTTTGTSAITLAQVLFLQRQQGITRLNRQR